MPRLPETWSAYAEVEWKEWTIEWIIHGEVISGPIRQYEDFLVSLLLFVRLLDFQSIRISFRHTVVERDEEDGRLYFCVQEGGLINYYCLVPPTVKAASSV